MPSNIKKKQGYIECIDLTAEDEEDNGQQNKKLSTPANHNKKIRTTWRKRKETREVICLDRSIESSKQESLEKTKNRKQKHSIRDSNKTPPSPPKVIKITSIRQKFTPEKVTSTPEGQTYTKRGDQENLSCSSKTDATHSIHSQTSNIEITESRKIHHSIEMNTELERSNNTMIDKENDYSDGAVDEYIKNYSETNDESNIDINGEPKDKRNRERWIYHRAERNQTCETCQEVVAPGHLIVKEKTNNKGSWKHANCSAKITGVEDKNLKRCPNSHDDKDSHGWAVCKTCWENNNSIYLRRYNENAQDRGRIPTTPRLELIQEIGDSRSTSKDKTHDIAQDIPIENDRRVESDQMNKIIQEPLTASNNEKKHTLTEEEDNSSPIEYSAKSSSRQNQTENMENSTSNSECKSVYTEKKKEEAGDHTTTTTEDSYDSNDSWIAKDEIETDFGLHWKEDDSEWKMPKRKKRRRKKKQGKKSKRSKSPTSKSRKKKQRKESGKNKRHKGDNESDHGGKQDCKMKSKRKKLHGTMKGDRRANESYSNKNKGKTLNKQSTARNKQIKAQEEMRKTEEKLIESDITINNESQNNNTEKMKNCTDERMQDGGETEQTAGEEPKELIGKRVMRGDKQTTIQECMEKFG